eukprot:15435623-Alexandrium_andersonii.AAC.1
MPEGARAAHPRTYVRRDRIHAWQTAARHPRAVATKGGPTFVLPLQQPQHAAAAPEAHITTKPCAIHWCSRASAGASNRSDTPS